MSRESIDQLARRLAESVPQGLKSMRSDLEENFRAVLKSGLARMDLVTREEFEVQEAVLARTREKVEALEARLDALGDAAGGKAAGKKSTGRKAGSKAGRSKPKDD